MGFINVLCEWIAELSEKEHIVNIAIIGFAIGVLIASLVLLFLIVLTD